MILSGRFSYLFRKSPLFRTTCILAVVLLVFICTSILSIQTQRSPVIDSLNPPVGSPGDVVIITGKHFGEVRDTSYVEFAGSRLTASSYISWNDTEIKVVLPANINNGLVFVGTKNNRSEPLFFANEREIPVAIQSRTFSSVPIVSSVSTENARIGDLIKIYGRNFGFSYENSNVFFSSNREKISGRSPLTNDQAKNIEVNLNYIRANKIDYDYEFWSDTEIHVRVPDGSVTGSLYVETPMGKSALQKITIDDLAGTKNYKSPKTYVVQLAADVSNISVKQDTIIRLYFPRPLITSSQPIVELTECKPEATILDYQNTIIHQLQVTKTSSSKKQQFSQNFVVSSFEINTTVKQRNIKSYSSMNENLRMMATKADKIIPSNDEKIKALAKEIVGKETNSYNIAKLIYDYMIDNYKLNDTRTQVASPLDLINKKRGDTYDYAIIYTALLRAAGIPALSNSGILVDKELRTKNHWWSEFYLLGVGWVPVDVALGDGLSYKRWSEIDDVRNYYFGNLDSQHITFTRGINDLKPTTSNSKIVQHPKGYALQSMWEEAIKDEIQYSSFWSSPLVLGVY